MEAWKVHLVLFQTWSVAATHQYLPADFSISPPADFVFESFHHPLLHRLSHISWYVFGFFFFPAHPEGCLGGLLFFGQSVICSAFIPSSLKVCFLVHSLLFSFTVFKIAIGIVRTESKEYLSPLGHSTLPSPYPVGRKEDKCTGTFKRFCSYRNTDISWLETANFDYY